VRPTAFAPAELRARGIQSLHHPPLKLSFREFGQRTNCGDRFGTVLIEALPVPDFALNRLAGTLVEGMR
jgi:hypothetical protein